MLLLLLVVCFLLFAPAAAPSVTSRRGALPCCGNTALHASRVGTQSGQALAGRWLASGYPPYPHSGSASPPCHLLQAAAASSTADKKPVVAWASHFMYPGSEWLR